MKREGVDLRRLKALYEDLSQPLRSIAPRYGKTHGWLVAIAAKEGWPPRRRITSHTAASRGRKSAHA